jgi:hypothetical protein
MLVVDSRGGLGLIYFVLIGALVAIGVLGRGWWTPVLGAAVLASPVVSELWEKPTPCGQPCIDESFYVFLGIVGAAITAVGALSRWLIVLAINRRRRRVAA